MYKLFVYGILKSMFDGRPATITAKCYHLGDYPAITEIGAGWNVQGLIIEVDSPTLEHLDLIEGYPDLYHRQLVEIDGEWVQVYVYTRPEDINHMPRCFNF